MAYIHDLRVGHRRRSIASGLDNLVREAHEPPSVLSAQVPFQRDYVLMASDDLAVLAQALRTTPKPSEAGVSAAGHLLTSIDSPVFEPQGPEAIRVAVREALALL